MAGEWWNPTAAEVASDSRYSVRDNWLYFDRDGTAEPVRYLEGAWAAAPGRDALEAGYGSNLSIFASGRDGQGGSFLESLGYTGPLNASAGSEGSPGGTHPSALAWLAASGTSIREVPLADLGEKDPTGVLGSALVGYRDGQAIGSKAYVVADDDPGNLFLTAILGAATFGVATAAGVGVGAATASIDAAASSAAPNALGWGAGYTVPGTGAYAGLSTAQLGTLAAGLDAGLSVAAAEAAAGYVSSSSLASAAIDAAPSSAAVTGAPAAGIPAAAAPAAAAAAPSIFGPGGVLGAIGQVAGVVGTGAGLVSQLTGGGSSVPPSLHNSPTQLEAEAWAAAQRRNQLLLIAGAVAVVVYLTRK